MSKVRQYVILAVVLASFLASSLALISSIQRRELMLRGYVDATQTIDLPYRPQHRLGVNAELLQYTDDRLQYHLGLMQQANVHWVRQFFHWNTTSSGELSDVDWAAWDRIVAAFEAYPQMRLVAVLTASSTEDFASFAEAFARRYQSQVDIYQVWDEPNARNDWNDRSLTPTEYVRVLQRTYSAIHGADPGAKIIAAALYPDAGDLTYLEALYNLGLSEFSDAIAAKPYGSEFAPDDRTVDIHRHNFSRLIRFRELMVANGDGQKQLWASNWGWNSQVVGDSQVTYTAAAWGRVEREWPWAGGMILDHWQPDQPDDASWGYRIIDRDDNPTALWGWLSNLESREIATNGLYALDSPFLSYHGIWTYADYRADMGWVNDSRVQFDFHGRDIAAIVQQGDYVAHLYPNVTDFPVNALPQDQLGNRYLSLKSADLQPITNVVPISRGLPLADHQLEIITDELIPDEIGNRWPLLGFAVSPGNLALAYDRQVLIALIATLITGVVTLWHSVMLARPRSHQLTMIIRLTMGLAISVTLLTNMVLSWPNQLLKQTVIRIIAALIISAIIYIDETGAILTLLACLILFVMIFNQLALGLALALFWSPYFLFPVEILGFAFPMAEIVLLITSGAWLLRIIANQDVMWRQKNAEFPTIPVINVMDYLILAWVAIAGLSLLWTDRTSLAMTELRVLFLEPLMFYIILRTLMPDIRLIRQLVGSLLAAGLVIAIIGLVTWLLGESIIEAEEGARRLVSVYGSPNNVALFLGRCFPFLLTGFLMLSDSTLRVLLGVSILIIGLSLALTLSAGALFIGVPISVAVVVLLVYQRRAIRPLIFLGVALTVGLVLASQVPRFERLTDFSQGTNFYRLRVWESTINLIEDQPLTGVGSDQFLYAYRDTYMLPDAWEEPDLSHPHNVLLDQWARYGIVGVIILGAMIWQFGTKAFRTYIHASYHGNTWSRTLIIGALGSMANLLAHGLVDNSIYVIDLVYIFVLLLIIPVVIFETNMRAIDAPGKTMV